MNKRTKGLIRLGLLAVISASYMNAVTLRVQYVAPENSSGQMNGIITIKPVNHVSVSRSIKYVQGGSLHTIVEDWGLYGINAIDYRITNNKGIFTGTVNIKDKGIFGSRKVIIYENGIAREE